MQITIFLLGGRHLSSLHTNTTHYAIVNSNERLVDRASRLMCNLCLSGLGDGN
jgi:hypothetical protein